MTRTELIRQRDGADAVEPYRARMRHQYRRAVLSLKSKLHPLRRPWIEGYLEFKRAAPAKAECSMFACDTSGKCCHPGNCDERGFITRRRDEPRPVPAWMEDYLINLADQPPQLTQLPNLNLN